MTKLISGRIAKVHSANVSADRYDFIGLAETEPDLGLPAASGYVLSSDVSGNRIWVDAVSAAGIPNFANTSGTANVAYTANIANTVLTLSNFTTANLVEGINLYYTNARVISAVTPYLTTANVTENNNLYYTNARVYSAIVGNLATKANVTDLTTANVTENNNLYYTNARVYSAIVGNLATKANVTDLTTANVTEDNNLYYTNSRVRSTLSGGTGVSYDITTGAISISQNVSTTSNVQFSNVRINTLVSDTGNIRISGNLIPTQDSVFNFGSLDKQWKDFYLSAESLFVGGQKISSNAETGLNVVNLTASNITTGNLVVTRSLIGNVTGTVSSLSNFTTSNLAEGINQYFTNARVTANLEQQSVNIFSDVNLTGITTNGILIWNGTAFVAGTIDVGATANSALISYQADHANTSDSSNVANSVLSLSGLTTANLLESNVNLYYTNARTRSAFIAGQNIIIESNGRISANLSVAINDITGVIENLSTNDIIEGNQNLYYTNSRVISAVTPYLTTANVIESDSNLYYTNSRVRSTLSEGTGVSYNQSTGQISIGQNVASTANVTFYNVSVTNNLIVYGGVTTYGANNISVSDNMIYLNSNSTVSNPDIGFAFNYNDGVYHHGGFFRDASDNGTFKVFENYSPEPDANIFIDTSHATFRLANLAATTFFGNVSGTAGSLSNFTTANLSEGNNLYYNNSRVFAYVSTNVTTGNISEANVNLYYTNARARSAFVAGPFINIAANGQISAVIDTANITLLQSNVVDLSSRVVSLENHTTSNVAEGSNLYYTNSRVRTAFTAGRGITISESGIINNTGSTSQYNTGIDGTVGANVLATMSPVITFSTTSADDRFLLRSLHLVNTSGATALVSSNVLYATGNTAYMANAIPVAPGGVMEFIKTYQIFQPGDKINLQGYNTAGTATANLMSVMLTYETFYNDTSYMGTGQTIASSDTNTKIYNSANSFSIIESVKFVNLQSYAVPISCYWGDANGVPKAYLAFGLQLPPNTSVELLQATKRINQNDGLYASYTAGASNGVSAFVSARYGAAYTIGSYTSSALPGNTLTASFGTSANEGTGLYYTIE